MIDTYLIQGRHPLQCRSDNRIDILNRFQYAFTTITLLIAITQLQSLVLAGGRTGRHRRTAHNAGL